MDDLLYELCDMGYDVDVIEGCEFDIYKDCVDESELLANRLKAVKYDCAISHMYIPQVADVCCEFEIKYISWIYDSPTAALYDKSVLKGTNYIYIFDYAEYDKLKNIYGEANLFYLPLAACTSRIDKVNISVEDEQKYSCDVSFVGNLYNGNQYDMFSASLSSDEHSNINAYINSHVCNWSTIRSWPRVTAPTVEAFKNAGYFETAKTYDMQPDIYLGVAIAARKLAQIERILILNELAKYEKVRLYTTKSNDMLNGVQVYPPVNYESDMSKVFNLSKINLNITIPSIETGLPQRVWDIIGSGGFCMTNYQPEIEEYFEIGKDIECFRNFDELRAKVRFYLTHEDARLQVLMNGYEKVRSKHTYAHRISEMMKMAKLF